MSARPTGLRLPSLALLGLAGLCAAQTVTQAGTPSAFLKGEAPAASPTQKFREAAKAVDAAWAALPLKFDHALFVSGKAPVYGAYQPRDSATFKPDDTIRTYFEPVGYTYVPADDGFVHFGVALDYEIVASDGTVATGKKSFLSWSTESRSRMKELMLNTSLDLGGFPEGDYVLHYTLHDLNGSRTADASLPFTVAK